MVVTDLQEQGAEARLPRIIEGTPTVVVLDQLAQPKWTDSDLLPQSYVRPGPEPTDVVSGKFVDPAFSRLSSWLDYIRLIAPAQREVESSPLTPSEALDRLRAWTGLSAAGIAELLGVARRSLYHWTSGGTRPRQEGRLFGLVRAIEPFAPLAEPWQLRDALDRPAARAAVEAGDMAWVRRVLDEIVAARPRDLQRAQADYVAEVEPLDRGMLSAHLRASSVTRTPRHPCSYVPRELTDSELPEDE